MNSCNLIGRLVSNAEIRTTQSGKAVATFCLAVKRPFTKDTTDFINCIAWEQKADYLGKYGGKGMKCAVSGVLQSRQYEDKSGNKRTAYEIVCSSVELLDGRQNAQQEQTVGTPEADAQSYAAADDDLPF